MLTSMQAADSSYNYIYKGAIGENFIKKLIQISLSANTSADIFIQNPFWIVLECFRIPKLS